ncbi:hypothetical protein [Hyphomonas sp.]|uniref:hypothetical protein n=1 Tax=Hyphomonas sp. TaxID=87 RepID=UPI0039191A32
MLHPSTKKLIDKLNEMTRKQRVAWIEGEDASVVHDTEGYRVILTPEPHGMKLTDALGREIETCSAEDFAGETDSAGRPYAQFVGELYREAHRHARGAERAIRTLLAGLEAAEAPIAAQPAEPELPPAEPDMTTDETAELKSEAAPDAEAAAEPAPAPEPAAALAEAPEPAAEAAPVAEVVAEPALPVEAAPDEPAAAEAPEPAPEPIAAPEAAESETPAPAPEPAPAQEETPVQAAPPQMQQRFSLSGIPYAAAGASLAEAAPEPEPKPAPPRTLIIDGTEDLPDIIPGIPEPRRNVNAIDAAPDGEGEPGTGGASRFNPWN